MFLDDTGAVKLFFCAGGRERNSVSVRFGRSSRKLKINDESVLSGIKRERPLRQRRSYSLGDHLYPIYTGGTIQ